MRNRWNIIPAVLLLAACSSSSSSTDATTTTAAPTVTIDTSAPTTTIADTTTVAPPSSAGTTVAPATSEAPSATDAPCEVRGNPLPEESADPLAMSALVGADIRVGDHACFERIVIELQGAGDFPGWRVAYVDDPVHLGESDETVGIEGTHTLLVRMGMWMQTMEGDGYAGPTQVFPTTVEHILELRMTENWEGMTIWAIGLDDEYSFTVDVLASPPRLVIDVQVPDR